MPPKHRLVLETAFCYSVVSALVRTPLSPWKRLPSRRQLSGCSLQLTGPALCPLPYSLCGGGVSRSSVSSPAVLSSKAGASGVRWCQPSHSQPFAVITPSGLRAAALFCHLYPLLLGNRDTATTLTFFLPAARSMAGTQVHAVFCRPIPPRSQPGVHKLACQ